MFQDVGLWSTGTVSVTGLAEPEEVPTLFVTDGVLPMLGAQPMLGRLFSKADDTPATPETVVLTAGYWRSKFGADRSAIGRTLMLDSRPREIIGVLPDTFRFLDREVSLVVPVPVRSQQGVPRPIQLHGHRAAEAGDDLDAGERRRRAADPDLADAVPAVPGRQRQDVRGGAHHAERHAR